MPTVALSPSILTHSCSLLYSRPSGCANFVTPLVKRQLDDFRAVSSPTNVNHYVRSGSCGFLFQQRRTDALVPDARSNRSAANLTDALLAQEDVLAFARGRAPVHHDAHDARIAAGGLLPRQRR